MGADILGTVIPMIANISKGHGHSCDCGHFGRGYSYE